jgi:bisphosphoglycerate-dependent phosphoglycerate mutase
MMQGMGELILIRHGETEWSRSGQHTGRTDIPLTDAGVAAGEALAPALGRRHLVAAFSSPLSRERMAHHEFADRRDLAAAVTVWTPTSSERYFRHKRRRREEIIRLPHTTADQAGSRTSASSSAKPSGSTHAKPARSRPANCIGRTYGFLECLLAAFRPVG